MDKRNAIMADESRKEDTMIFACEEHIELALDIAVDEWEAAPIVEKCKEEKGCSYCEQTALYTLTK